MTDSTHFSQCLWGQHGVANRDSPEPWCLGFSLGVDRGDVADLGRVVAMGPRAPSVGHTVITQAGQGQVNAHLPGETAPRSPPRSWSRSGLPSDCAGCDSQSLLSEPEPPWICVQNGRADKPHSEPELAGEHGVHGGWEASAGLREGVEGGCPPPGLGVCVLIPGN